MNTRNVVVVVAGLALVPMSAPAYAETNAATERAVQNEDALGGATSTAADARALAEVLVAVVLAEGDAATANGITAAIHERLTAEQYPDDLVAEALGIALEREWAPEQSLALRRVFVVYAPADFAVSIGGPSMGANEGRSDNNPGEDANVDSAALQDGETTSLSLGGAPVSEADQNGPTVLPVGENAGYVN